MRTDVDVQPKVQFGFNGWLCAVCFSDYFIILNCVLPVCRLSVGLTLMIIFILFLFLV